MDEQDNPVMHVQELLFLKDWAGARNLLRDVPAPDIADLLLALAKNDRILLFRLLPRSQASDAFSYLESSQKDEIGRASCRERV